MLRFDAYTRQAIKFWEIRRGVFCVIVAIPAYWSHMLFSSVQAGLDYPQNGTPAELALRYFCALVFLNICYSFAYALEFLLRSDNPRAIWLAGGRDLTFVAGCLLGCALSFYIGSQLGIFEFSFR